MSIKSQYQAELREVFAQAEALQDKVESAKRAPTAEENSLLSGYSAKASEIAKQIDAFDQLEAVKNGMTSSEGSVVAAGWSREALPGEGVIPGVTADKSGNMYAFGDNRSAGEKKLDALKSGAYTDAVNSFLRTKGLNRGELKGDAMKILNEGSDPAGGFWIPPAFNPELVKKMAVMSTVRPNAKVYTTGSDHLTFPAVNYNGSATDDTYASLFTSGVRFSWRGSVGSTSDFSEATNPIAGTINIPVQLATASIVVMREMLEDASFDLLGYITDLGAEAFALGEENAFTNGSGAGQPRGFVNHPAMAIGYSTYATSAGTTYWGNKVLTGSTTVTWGNGTTGVLGCDATLPPQYENNAKWSASKATYSALSALNAGTATLPQWGFGESWPNFSTGLSQQLLRGYPILKNQFVTTVTNAAQFMYLGDMTGYYIIDRVGMSVDVNPYIYQNRDQVLIYMRKRVGGDLVQYWKMRALSST